MTYSPDWEDDEPLQPRGFIDMAIQRNANPHPGDTVEVGEPAKVVKAWLKLRQSGGQISVSGVTQTRPTLDSLEVAVPIELHVDPEVFKPKPVPIVIDGGVTASPHIVGKQRTQR